MTLYSHLFFSTHHAEIADETRDLSRMLLFESTLAKVQAELGIVPKEAAQMIHACAKVEYLDVEKLKTDIRMGGNVAIPLVQQLTRIVKNNYADASKYVHLGATSQDVIDTATVLEIREWSQKLEDIMAKMGAVLLDLIRKYESTVMIGRTLQQQAKPITFGLKLATYLEALLRHQIRLSELENRVMSLQLSGAVGAGNTFIPEEVGRQMAKELGLHYTGSWHTHRDSIVEWSCYLANLTGFCGKIATDISLLMQTEVAEVFEGAAEGKGGSSTMPHKRNPVTCAIIIANSSRTPQLAATMLANMPQEHERSAGKWHAEWETLKTLHLLSVGALEKTLDLLGNLEVDAVQMAKNLELTNGLIYAENVSLALSGQLGKLQAHEMVEKACKQAIKSGLHLREVCENMLGDQLDLNALLSAENSIGNARNMIQFIIEKYENSLYLRRNV